MKRFAVKVTLTCPSSWTVEQCRSYIERIAIGKDERETIEITEIHETPEDWE